MRVLALDPTYHLAYQHVVEVYNVSAFGGQQWCFGGRCQQVIAIPRPDGDSLLYEPLVLPRAVIYAPCARLGTATCSMTTGSS